MATSSKPPLISWLRTPRERTGASLERAHPRTPPRERILLLLPEAAAGYFRDFIAELRPPEEVICLPLPEPGEVPIACQTLFRESGPCKRIFLVMEQAKTHAAATREIWRQLQEQFQDTEPVHVRFIGCRPSFDLWLLLHFEAPGVEADNPEALRNKVAALLQK
ncbi:MAG: hypothetical protein HQM02_06755, partial [Magnetococcales bacterium]|nr:hypothetical protein [Magnetococcales bacterium]